MPIFAKNIIVGGQKPPTVEKEKINLTTFESIKAEAKRKVVKKEALPLPPIEKERKYIYKEDGVLIRHINVKSNYLKDIFDLDF